MTIRKPRPDEQAVVAGLVQDVTDEIYGGQWAEPPLPIGDEDWTQGWVAELDGAIIGVVLTHDARVEDLWIARGARGFGIGAQLLARAEREIVDRGHQDAVLRVVATNTHALAFYERNGWQRVCQVPHETLPIEMIEMTKHVGS